MGEEKGTPEVVSNIHEKFKGKGLTLSLAESCTGGLISHYLTTLPGASGFFEAGIVSYSAAAKKLILGVSPETISRHGVVSDEVAREMAEKVRTLAGTDYSVSTTGNLGPDVLEGKERGLIYIAVSRSGETVVRELRLHSDREINKAMAARAALELLDDMVE